MLFSTVGQGPVFLWMAGAGAAIGLWYAALAALRRLLRAGLWLSLAADAAFGAGAAALFCGSLYTANYGRFRLYTLLAAALGFALTAAGLYPPAKRAGRALVTGLRQILVRIQRNRFIKVIFR